MSIGHICAHDLGNQRTSPYTLDFPSKSCRPQSLKLDSSPLHPKLCELLLPMTEKHFAIISAALSIAIDTLSNDWEITFPSSSSSASRIFLLLEDIASYDDTRECTTLIYGDLWSSSTLKFSKETSFWDTKLLISSIVVDTAYLARFSFAVSAWSPFALSLA